MHAAALFRTEGDARTPEIEEKMDGSLPAINPEGTRYLDGRLVYHGTAANHVEETIQKVHVHDNTISTSREETLGRKAVEFYADVSTDPGFIGVSSAKSGEWFLRRAAAQTGVTVMDTRVDVEAFAEHIRDEATAQAWNVSKSRDYGGGKEKTSIDYHDSADLNAATKGTIGLGFDYFWQDSHMEGIAYEGGYVALYTDTITEVFAKWVREEILPYLEVVEHDSEQVSLTDEGGVEEGADA